jgi:HEAT repeat protein
MGPLRLCLGATLLALTACATNEPPPKTWEEIRAERVQDFMAHLNNDSRSERWRDGMIDVGQKSEEDRVFVVVQCQAAYSESMNRGGVGTGVLRTPGRRRVMEIIAEFGDKKETRSLLRQGLKDDDEVALAASAGLAAWGDDSAIPRLFSAILALPESDAGRKSGLQALRRAAKPKRRAAFLNAVGDGDIRVLEPILMGTFPTDPEARLAQLRQVASSHKNPYARRFGMEQLIREKDTEVIALARKVLKSNDRVMRPVALKALGAVGGDQAANEIEKVLKSDPADARAVVRGLYEVATPRALELALETFADEELKPRTRAAIAREFLGKMKDEGAPSAYRKTEALEEALAALRSALEEGIELLTIHSVDAIGRIGDRDADVDPLLALLEDPSSKVAPIVVRALGRLGGEFAAARLIDLVSGDPELRDVAAKALGAFKSTRDVPVYELINMLESEDEGQRAGALKALKGLRRSTDAMGYKPADTENDRIGGVERWRAWWKSRSGR